MGMFKSVSRGRIKTYPKCDQVISIQSPRAYLGCVFCQILSPAKKGAAKCFNACLWDFESNWS